MTRIVDLTFPIEEGMTTFPTHWHPLVEVSQMGRHGIENRESRKLVIGTHTGTHCDAPSHFIPGGRTIDQIPLETLIGPARVLDLSDLPDRFEIGPDLLRKRLGARVPRRLLLRYDWDKHWGKMKYYQDHPFLAPTAARWLLARGVRVLGVDAPMPDNPNHGWKNDPDSPIHKILLRRKVVLLEYLTNLRKIRSREFQLVAMPLRIRGGDGAPMRCAAVEG